MQVSKKFQPWELKLGPFLWPNLRFKGFTGQRERKMCNFQMEIDLPSKKTPKFSKIQLPTEQCKTATLQPLKICTVWKNRVKML